MKTHLSRKSAGLSKLTAVLATISMFPALFATGPTSASITGCQYSGGNWIISQYTVATNENLYVDGNIIVTSTLVLQNTTINMECQSEGEFSIDVQDGGCLIIDDVDGDPSTIRSAGSYHYVFRIRDGASAEFRTSEIRDCGYYAGGSIDYRSGLSVESSDVTIEGCAITNNYIGLVLDETITMDVNPYCSDELSYFTTISNNSHSGVYLKQNANVEINGAIICDNQYNLYLEAGSCANLYDCADVEASTVGGPGAFSQFSSSTVHDNDNYFELLYNSDAQTERYEGWEGGSGDEYADTNCVLRRGYQYEIELQLKKWANWVVNHGNFRYKVNQGLLMIYLMDLEYPIEPDADHDLTLYQIDRDSARLTIPSDYPILYFKIVAHVIWLDGNPYDLQSITACVIFDIPPTVGSDLKYELPQAAIDEYLYMGDDGTASGLLNNMDNCCPYWDSSSTYYYYGTSTTETPGLSIFDFDVVKIACTIAQNCIHEWDAAEDIQWFMNVLVHGDWTSNNPVGRSNSAASHFEYITQGMLDNWDTWNGINTAHGAGNAANDALGLHASDTNGQHNPNNWVSQCMDFAALSISLDRSIGMASRPITGLGYSHFSFHVWTEVWIPDDGDSQTSYDELWNVFDACGVIWDDVNENPACSEDTDDNGNKFTCYSADTRENYYDNLDPDYGDPTSILIFHKTSGGQTSYNVVTDYSS